LPIGIAVSVRQQIARQRAADARRDETLRRAGLRGVKVAAELAVADVELATEVVRGALRA